MKKIITLTFFIGAFATSFAQYNHPGADTRYDGQYAYSSGANFNGHNNFMSPRERDFQIDKINREYQFNVRSIEQNPLMRRHQKKIAVRNAGNDRNFKIQMLNKKYFGQFPNNYGRR